MPDFGSVTDLFLLVALNQTPAVSSRPVDSYTLDVPECVALFKEPENFGIIKSDPETQLPDSMDNGEGENISPTSAPTKCPSDFYSITGVERNYWTSNDNCCWEEKVQVCATNTKAQNIEAWTKMAGHWLNAAKQLEFGSEWQAGGSYWKGGVKKGRCITRLRRYGSAYSEYKLKFTENQLKRKFMKPLNYGKMYDD